VVVFGVGFLCVPRGLWSCVVDNLLDLGLVLFLPLPLKFCQDNRSMMVFSSAFEKSAVLISVLLLPFGICGKYI
jgi:hypothetical protein